MSNPDLPTIVKLSWERLNATLREDISIWQYAKFLARLELGEDLPTAADNAELTESAAQQLVENVDELGFF